VSAAGELPCPPAVSVGKEPVHPSCFHPRQRLVAVRRGSPLAGRTLHPALFPPNLPGHPSVPPRHQSSLCVALRVLRAVLDPPLTPPLLFVSPFHLCPVQEPPRRLDRSTVLPHHRFFFPEILASSPKLAVNGNFQKSAIHPNTNGFSAGRREHLSAQQQGFLSSPTNFKILLQSRKAPEPRKIKDAAFIYLYKRRRKSA